MFSKRFRKSCLFLLLGLFSSFVLGQNGERGYPDLDPLTDSLRNKGKRFEKNGQPDSALYYFRNALELAERIASQDGSGAWEPYVQTCLDIGLLYQRRRKYQEAQTYLERGWKKAATQLGENAPLTANSLHQLAVNHEFQHQFEKALDRHLACLKIREQIHAGPHPHLALTLRHLGATYSNLYQYDIAGTYYQRALSVLEKLDGPPLLSIITLYIDLGIDSRRRGFYERAVQFFNRALERARNRLSTEKATLARCYYQLGTTYLYTGDYFRALDYYLESLAIYEKIYQENAYQLTFIYTDLAQLYEQMGNYSESIHYYQKSLHIFQQAESSGHFGRYYTGLLYNHLGRVFTLLGQYREAAARHQAALQTLTAFEGGDKQEIAHSHRNLGTVFTELKDFNRARAHLEEALRIYASQPNTNSIQIAITHQRFAQLFSRQNDFKQALAYCQQALIALSESFEDSNLEANPDPGNMRFEGELLATLTLKADLLFRHYLAREGRKKELRIAHETYGLASRLIDRIRTGYRARGSKQTLLDKAKTVYGQAIKVALHGYEQFGDPSFLEDAFTFSEKSKGILLLETLKNTDARRFAGIPGEQLERENELSNDLAFLEKQLFSETEKAKPDSGILDRLRRAIFDLKREYYALIESFEKNHPDYHRLKYETGTVSIDEIRATLLQPDQALVEYFTQDSSLYAFILTSDTFRCRRIPHAGSLKQWTENLRSGICDSYVAQNSLRRSHQKTAAQYVRYARLLYDTLIAPLGELPEQLVIVPDGVLGYVPFETLLAKKPVNNQDFRNHAYLMKQHRISYNYSATLWKEMAGKRAPSCRLLGVAPEFKPSEFIADNIVDARTRDFGPLEFNVEEVRDIQKLIGGKIIYGEQATVSRWLDLAPRYGVLHLSTHAKVNDENTDFSFLAFAGGESDSLANKLFIRDLYQLQLPAHLVVLSACETGTGTLKRGEGIISLARGFSYAGAKSLITSLWKANDRSSYEIMRAFYDYLHDGLPKDAALWQAKKTYLESAKADEAHPFFWAAFVASGDMQPLPACAGKSSPVWFWMIMIPALLGAGGLAYRYFKGLNNVRFE